MDKRKEDRFNTKLMVKLRIGDLKAWGMLQDISPNGVLVRSNHQFKPEAPVDIDVIMPDGETATIRGIVKRVEVTSDAHRKFAIGIKIIEKNMIYSNLVKYAAAKNRCKV